MSKYCTNCGEAINESNKFCNNCGFKLDKKERENIKVKKNGMNTGKLVVLLLVLLVIGSTIITIAMFTFSSITYNPPVFANSSDELVDRYDYNNDGLISFNEYRDMHLDATFATLPSENISRSNFNMMDLNEDSYLESGELGMGLSLMNEAYESNVEKNQGKSS